MRVVYSTLPIPPHTDEWLEKMRASRLSTDDNNIYLLIGYFYSWFSAVEMVLTMMLAQVGGFTRSGRDLEAFELISSGLQPRQKIDRLRQLAKKSGCKIGPNLDHFLKELLGVIDLRNQLSHAKLTAARKPGHFQIRTLSKQEGKGARVIRELDLFAQGLWLHELASDLLTALPADIRSQPKTLEIAHPHIPVDKVSSPKPPRPKRPSSAGKPAQKRARKASTQKPK